MDDFFCAIVATVAQSPVLPHRNQESVRLVSFLHMIHDMICLFHDPMIHFVNTDKDENTAPKSH